MECRELEITLYSAKNLRDIRLLGKMKVYAKVSISGDPDSELETVVDMNGETNPIWNCKIKYTLAEETVQKEGVFVIIKLYCKRSFGRDRYVGEVKLCLKSLFENGPTGENLHYNVRRNDSKGTFGTIILSCNIGENASVEVKPSRLGKILNAGTLFLLQAGIEVGVANLF